MGHIRKLWMKKNMRFMNMIRMASEWSFVKERRRGDVVEEGVAVKKTLNTKP
jgi:hypothetical protein